jgi:hypothetical protein
MPKCAARCVMAFMLLPSLTLAQGRGAVQAPANQSAGIQIKALQGPQGTNDLSKQSTVRPRVQVLRGATPVQGAQVTFKAPDTGATVHYPDGGVRALAETDVGGFASAPVSVPVNEGEVIIEVSARYQDQTASMRIVQRNVNPCPANMRGLRLEEGEGNSASRDVASSSPFSVQVRLYRECQPLSNAIVTFTVPGPGTGPGAALAGNNNTYGTGTSDTSGYAKSPQMTPNSTDGDWELRVSATSNGETARLAIKERNTKLIAAPPPKPSNAWKYLVGIAVPAVAVGALCGSGHCGSKSASPTPTPTPTPVSPCAVVAACTVTISSGPVFAPVGGK